MIVYMGKVLEIKVRVNLGRGDTRMAEQFLDGAQVAAGFEEMRREGVSEYMRVDRKSRAPTFGPLFEPCLDATTR